MSDNTNTRALIKIITTAYEEDLMDEDEDKDSKIIEEMMDAFHRPVHRSTAALNDVIPDLAKALKKIVNKMDTDEKEEKETNTNKA